MVQTILKGTNLNKNRPHQIDAIYTPFFRLKLLGTKTQRSQNQLIRISIHKFTTYQQIQKLFFKTSVFIIQIRHTKSQNSFRVEIAV